MSVEQIARALNVADDRLTPVDRLVLIGIANHDGDGGSWPAIATLARYAGVAPRSARRSVGRLVEFGYVTRHERAGGKPATPDYLRPNFYELTIPDRGTEQSPPDTTVLGPPDTTVLGGRTDVSSEPSLEPSASEPSSALVPTDASPRVHGTLGELVEEWFPKFWEAYPRKVGKPVARRAFRAALQRAPVPTIADGLRRWREHWEADNRPEFIPHPATWLNQDRWDDEPTPPSKPRSKTASTLDALAEHARRMQHGPEAYARRVGEA